MSRADAFVATTWWTAHIAHAALRSLEADRFLYLIQEYEPFTFPMGSHAALAAESYRLPHAALFSTELLRDYFRRHGLGVYAAGAATGDGYRRRSTTRSRRSTRRTPPRWRAGARAGCCSTPGPSRTPPATCSSSACSPSAARSSAARSPTAGACTPSGPCASGRRLDLGGGASIDLLPRSPQAAYGQLLREHDVGLALMFTPHPSLVPMEMASAGMLTVTNTFENKTAEALAAISPNLLAAEPGIEAVAAALCEAADGADDVERRLRGSDVRWPRDWDELVRRRAADPRAQPAGALTARAATGDDCRIDDVVWP